MREKGCMCRYVYKGLYVDILSLEWVLKNAKTKTHHWVAWDEEAWDFSLWSGVGGTLTFHLHFQYFKFCNKCISKKILMVQNKLLKKLLAPFCPQKPMYGLSVAHTKIHCKIC